MSRFKILLAVVGLSFAVGQTSMAAIIQNGSFETLANPIVGSGLDDYTSPVGLVDPDTGVPGWHLSQSTAPDYTYDMRVYGSSPHSGSASMLMEGGWMYQDIALEAGPMQVSFYAQAYGNPDLAIDPVAVTLDGVPLLIGGAAKVTAPAFVNNETWTKYTTDAVSVTAGTHRLQFTSDPYVGTVTLVNIDDVSVTATPEPASFVLLATGFLGLLAYAWRKRK